MYINYQDVGQRIAKRRKALGLKQFEVNERAGLSDKYLSHIETARTTPSIEVLMKICIALDTTPDYLLLGTINENTEQQLREKLMLIHGEKKKALLNNFMDWLINTEI